MTGPFVVILRVNMAFSLVHLASVMCISCFVQHRATAYHCWSKESEVPTSTGNFPGRHNVVFAVHHGENIKSEIELLVKSIAINIYNYVDNFRYYSIGLCTFSNSSTIDFFDRQFTDFDNYGPYSDVDFEYLYSNIKPNGIGSRIDLALQSILNLLWNSPVKYKFTPNLCVLLTTSPPDNRTLALAAAKSLWDNGISVMAVAVGDGVTKEDIEDLTSNKNVAFTVPSPGNVSIEEIASLALNASDDVIDAHKFARFLPRYGYCYYAERTRYIIVDVLEGHVDMLKQLRDFMALFPPETLYDYLFVKILNGPVTDTIYKGLLNSVKEGLRWSYKIHEVSGELNEATKLYCDEFNVLYETVFIIVTDRPFENTSAFASTSLNCQKGSIHVMTLGVGKGVSINQLSMIASDPKAVVMVSDMEHLKKGLDDINLKMCPAVCDLGWTYREEMCYHYEKTDITWLESRAECEKYKSKLVSITSNDMMAWITTEITAGQVDPVYIGLRKHRLLDTPISSHWRWENGKPLVLSNWSTHGDVSQPDGAMQEACVAWYPDGWRDMGCSFKLKAGWLCEKEARNKTNVQKATGVQIRPLWEEKECDSPDGIGSYQQIPTPTGADCRVKLEKLRTKLNMEHTYNCTSGELISKYLLCDGVHDCKDNSDERNCSDAVKCSADQFQCDNGRCVSLVYFCDFWDDCGDNSDEKYCDHPNCKSNPRCDSGQCISHSSDCDLLYDCYDKSDEARCSETCRGTSCYDGTCIPRHWAGDGEVDCSGTEKEDEKIFYKPDFCYTGLHKEILYIFYNHVYADERPKCTMIPDGYGKYLKSFKDTECDGSIRCPVGFYQCPSSYCIPLESVCDGVMDCLDGQEEIGCDEYVCPGYFRCPGVRYCIHPMLLCDGYEQCPGGKDETMCNFQCPSNCTCFGGVLQCKNSLLNGSIPEQAKKIHISSTDQGNSESDSLLSLSVPTSIFSNLQYIREIVLNGVGLITLENIFKNNVNLVSLNISNNKVSTIPAGSFLFLGKLRILDLSSNPLNRIGAQSLSGLSQLKEMYMRKTALTVIEKEVFTSLVRLEILDISGSSIHTVSDEAFQGLESLKLLNMKGNNIVDFGRGVYHGLTQVKEIYTDIFSLCCPVIRPISVEDGSCVSPKASISSCSDLMANDILRTVIWIQCIASLVGNVLSTVLRVIWERNSMKNGFGVFVTHLGISDFFMGVYLLIIAIADMKYKGVYIWHDHEWRESLLCKIAGLLATLSSEASTFFICLITVDRFMVIKFPFGQVRFNYRSATLVSLLAWLIAAVIAIVPLIPRFDNWNFYSKNGACLALPFFTEKSEGWIYSVLVFIGLNFFTFIVIAIGQYSIYRAMKQGSLVSSKTRSAKDMAVARRLLLVVSTDFLCWFPIGVMSLLALSGVKIGGEVYAWTAVFVLPVNSALNPFLYTIPAVLQKMRQQKGNTRAQQSTQGTLSITIGEPGNNLVPLENALSKLRTTDQKVKLINDILSGQLQAAGREALDSSKLNAIYVGLKGKEMTLGSVCFTRKEDHERSEVTSLVLSLSGLLRKTTGGNKSRV